MTQSPVLHSICRWTFHAGKGGFLPADVRPEWAAERFSSADFVRLVHDRIRPRLSPDMELGVELHYDTEICEQSAFEVADALVSSGVSLAMITPGLHSHFGYGGVASLDPMERDKARELSMKTVDLAYGPLRKSWHKDAEFTPTLVLWNGSYGYDLATVGIQKMYEHLKESIAALCKHEEHRGGLLRIGLEPKPNEGHPAMLIPTVASALLFWRRIEEQYGISRERCGLNMELGHTEMIGLDHVYDIVEQLDNKAVMHIHLNSQGYNDGIIFGGPGKYDIDHGVRINGMNIAIAGLLKDGGYLGWKGHDMQPRPYDNEDQAVDRVVRSVLSWEACEHAAAMLDKGALLQALEERGTAKAEDMMRQAVVSAQLHFDEMYN